jgi:hypothetical protein
VLAFAYREPGMVKNNFCAGVVFGNFELHNRVDAGIPIRNTPCLDNSLLGYTLEMATHNMAAEKRECAAYLPTDFCRSFARRHAGLHSRTELFDFAKLSGIGKRFINAPLRRVKDRFLMDRFRRVGN